MPLMVPVGGGGAANPLLSWIDVKAWILRRAEEPLDGTSDWDSDTDTAIEEAWRDLYTRHPWMCLMQYPPAALVLPLPVTNDTGLNALTLSASVGAGVTGTLSGIPGDPSAPGTQISLLNYVFIPNGVNYISRVTAHTAGQTTLTLDAVPVTLTTQGGKFVKLEFDLPANFGLFVNGWWGQDKSFIPVRDAEEMRRQYPDPPPSGLPVLCARITKTKVRFSHYSDIVRRLEAEWTIEPTENPGGTAPLSIDRHLIPILARLGLWELYLLKGDNSRADRALKNAEDKIERAILYEDRLRLTLGRESTKTQVGPYSDASPFGRVRTRGPV